MCIYKNICTEKWGKSGQRGELGPESIQHFCFINIIARPDRSMARLSTLNLSVRGKSAYVSTISYGRMHLCSSPIDIRIEFYIDMASALSELTNPLSGSRLDYTHDMLFPKYYRCASVANVYIFCQCDCGLYFFCSCGLRLKTQLDCEARFACQILEIDLSRLG